MNIVKLTPAYKSIIWGGNKLKTNYDKKTDLSPLAETWELSFHKAGECTLPDGTPLSAAATDADLGENCKGFDFFPVLVKFIDAQDKLSVQVHPADEYALKHENSLGKTEMWYIADADEGAGIYLGFKENISRETFERAIKEKTLTEYLKFIPVKPGESYFIPAGTIHAICSGCLICEIQQNSNITYRVYDYGRRDKDGNERELHIEKALAVTNTYPIEPKELNVRTVEGVLKGISRFFTATLVEINAETKFEKDAASFRHFTCLDGEGKIGGVGICKGESLFVPAGHEQFTLEGKFTAIMTTVRKYYLRIEKDSAIKASVIDDRGELIKEFSAPVGELSEGEIKERVLRACGLTASDIS